jgi:predicted nucleic acid-binding protein
MIVVADSSPLVVLVNIGQIDLLRALFQQILIPPDVAAELASAKRPEAVRAFIAAPPPWLKTRSPSSIESIVGLHAGEAAAISLAREVQASRLIIDEQRGRKAAAHRNLRVVGTIGVLELAAEMGLIELEHTFEKVKQTDFWLAPNFLDERLARFRNQKRERADTAELSEPPQSTGRTQEREQDVKDDGAS